MKLVVLDCIYDISMLRLYFMNSDTISKIFDRILLLNIAPKSATMTTHMR